MARFPRIQARWWLVSSVLVFMSCTESTAPPAPQHLSFTTQPTNATAGDPINPGIAVAIQDSAGQTIAAATSLVTLEIATNPGSGALAGTASVAAVNGVATFSNVSINKAAAGYALKATASGATEALSSLFDITAGPAAQLVFGVQPGSARAGGKLTLVVTALDSLGNTAIGFTGDVTVALGTNPASGTLAGTMTVAAVNGVATFSTLSIDRTGNGYTLTAAATGLTGATSAGFNITAAFAARLVFTGQPSNALGGAPISPMVQVTARDTFGNTATDFKGSVVIAIAVNPAGGSLTGSTVATAASGVASFSNLKIDKAGAGYTLATSSTGLANDTSTAFAVSVGPAARLGFLVQPVNSNTGDTIKPAVQVAALDAGGNTVTGFTGGVTVAIGSNPAGGVLSGTKLVNAVAGVATFSDLSIQASGTPYTLTAASGGLTGVTSAPFAVAYVQPALHVTTATTGPNASSNYTLCVDPDYGYYGCFYYYGAIGANSAVTVNVSAGTHVVQLSDIPANCLVNGSNPDTVIVTHTTDVPFSITCADTGSVHVSVATTGTDIDVSGYAVCVDNPNTLCAWNRQVHPDDAGLINGVTVGSHKVRIYGVAENCSVGADTVVTVTVSANSTTNTSWAVACVLAERIAYSNNGTIGVIHADGSAPTTVSSGTAPAWSSDATRLAYECYQDICTVNSDGTAVAFLTTDGASNRHPTWSPDGSKIAFSATHSGATELWVIGTNGSGASELTNGVGFVGSPAWSPDGTKIVFDCQVDVGNDDICVVNVDGSGFTRLTTDPARDHSAAWKPDGSTLAFATTRYGTADEIVLISAAGGAVSRIGTGLPGSLPTWSPDGARLAFVRYDYYGTPFLNVGHADGSGFGFISYGDQPAWKPHP